MIFRLHLVYHGAGYFSLLVVFFSYGHTARESMVMKIIVFLKLSIVLSEFSDDSLLLVLFEVLSSHLYPYFLVLKNQVFF